MCPHPKEPHASRDAFPTRGFVLHVRRATMFIRLLTVGGLIAGTAPAAGARVDAGCDVTRQPGCVAWAQHLRLPAPHGRNGGRTVATSADGGAYAARRVAVTDSRVFVAGQRAASHELVVLAVDARTGRTSWLADHAATPAGPAEPVAVVATPGGERVFVTAISWKDRPY